MEWWVVLLFFFGLLLLLIFLGFPIAAAFIICNIIAVSFLMGFGKGLNQLIYSMHDAISKFVLTPIPLFVLMGELLFRSDLANRALNVMDKLLGRIPGRLSVLAIGSGTAFAALSGSSMANTSMLGSVLVPDMRKRGYDNRMTMGPIMAAGSLAMIIPPSSVTVLYGGISNIPIGPLLIAGIIPGIVMASLFFIYIMIACKVNPMLAPSYTVQKSPLTEKIKLILTDVLPLGLIVFLVLGLIFLGIATPTESAALGALGTIILLVIYRSFNFKVMKKALTGTLRTNAMIMLIIATSAGYSQVLSYTGASRGLVEFITGFEVPSIMIIIVLLLIVIFLGMFMEPISVMMILVPLYIPIVSGLEYELIWFAIMMLICLDIGNLTPPVGMLLFVMKGVVPKDISMGEVYRSAIPFVMLEASVVVLCLIFPALATWLPSLGA